MRPNFAAVVPSPVGTIPSKITHIRFQNMLTVIIVVMFTSRITIFLIFKLQSIIKEHTDCAVDNYRFTGSQSTRVSGMTSEIKPNTQAERSSAVGWQSRYGHYCRIVDVLGQEQQGPPSWHKQPGALLLWSTQAAYGLLQNLQISKVSVV